MTFYRVENGIDRIGLYREKFAGKRIAILTAASGVDKQGIPSYLRVAEYGRLSVIFAPEHGIRTNAQDGKYGAEEYEPMTGARICNLNSRDYSEPEELLSEVDLFCYDIQDVGARFYTYLWSLYDLMQICARKRVPVLIFDRPNPIGGERVEGGMLDPLQSSFIGRTAIPTRYGLTVGELMTYLNEKDRIGCELFVLPMEGWKRSMYYDETDLLFVNPSPNIPSVETAFHYLGNCLWEATNLSEGRGTTKPFSYIGAPYVNGDEMYAYLVSLGLPGVTFVRASFTPQFNKWAGETCEGVSFHLTDRETYEPTAVMLYLFEYLKGVEGFTYKPASVALRFGSEKLLSAPSVPELLSEIRRTSAEFQKETETFWRY